MPIVKVFKTNKSFAVIIPREVADDQRIYAGTFFDMTSEEYGRIILQRLQFVTPPPEGSTWTLVKA